METLNPILSLKPIPDPLLIMGNSWLSFALPDDTKSELTRLTKTLFQDLEKEFKLKPMSHPLHMTAVFFGEKFKRQDQEKVMGIIGSHDLSGEFVFKSLEFFPPQKKRLIVARYGTSQKVLDEIVLIKREIRGTLGYEIDDFELIPHVTLGKLGCPREELDDLVNGDSLSKIKIPQLQREKLNFAINETVPLHMCGKF